MSVLIEGLLHGWRKNLDYGQRLVADLSEQQMVHQPADSPANHPAWILSHLNAYLPVVSALIQDQEIDDPLNHRFGMLSKPESDRAVYPAKQELVNTFIRGHESAEALLSNVDELVLDQLVPFERWKDTMPKIGIALPYLMLCHENMHLGQLSAWRRVQGLPSV